MKQLPKDVVITVDGKIVSTEEFNKISPEKIKSIQVIKDTPEHKAGLIEVQLKKE